VIQALGSSGVKGSAMVDGIVDKILSLKIVIKIHEFYLEETPEKFEVRPYDEHSNEFSTLKGLKFRWMVESQENKVKEGIKTGSAKVLVKMVHPLHSFVPAAVEPLMVVANLLFLPQ
jgi:hypothetical protein